MHGKKIENSFCFWMEKDNKGRRELLSVRCRGGAPPWSRWSPSLWSGDRQTRPTSWRPANDENRPLFKKNDENLRSDAVKMPRVQRGKQWGVSLADLHARVPIPKPVHGRWIHRPRRASFPRRPPCPHFHVHRPVLFFGETTCRAPS